MSDGSVLGYVSDIEMNTQTGSLTALIIYGRLKFFGIFGRDDDVIIPWSEISVIGHETILVQTDPSKYLRYIKKKTIY